MTDLKDDPMAQTGEKHTPLPWYVDRKRVRHASDARRTPAVAECFMTHGLGAAGEEDAANAAFIVRACNSHHDLLAALKAVHEHCPCDKDINPRWNAAWDAMEAAIAKAEA